jgi:phosphopantetheine--protein transferase-like protein
MIGIDLIHLPEFENMIRNIDPGKVFTRSELMENPGPESLAGVFAIKEAFFKALGKKTDWLDLRVEKDPGGKPLLYVNIPDFKNKAAVSISHSGEYTTAVVMII